MSAGAIEEEISVHAGEEDSRGRRVSPWAWMNTVYFAQGLQYAIVTQLFVIVFFTMGIGQGDILFWIGLLTLPWTIKPLWGPIVDRYWTKRSWTWSMQIIVGLCFLGTAAALLIPGTQALIPKIALQPPFFYGCLIFLFILAIAGATHDIACDGFYMMALNQKQQAFFVGVRSTVFRIALIFANGILIWMAGLVQSGTGLPAGQVEITALPKESALVASSDQIFAGEVWQASSEQALLIRPGKLEIRGGEEEFVTLRLAQPPENGSQIVVLRFTSRNSKGLSIPKSSERLEFTSANWQTGIDVPVTADAKTASAASDVLRIQSGNIPLSWSFVCVLCGASFFMLGVLHRFILPYPITDKSDAVGRPNILIPLGALALTIGIPWALGYSIFYSAGRFRDAARDVTVGVLPKDEKVAGALQGLRATVDAQNPDVQQAFAGRLFALLGSLGTNGLPETPTELDQTVTLRDTLARYGLIDDAALADRLYTGIEAERANPDFAASHQLRRLLAQVKKLNGDKPPASREKVEALVAELRLPALVAIEADVRALAKPLANVRAASGGKLPADQARIQAVLDRARTTPSVLEMKGFTFFFTASRLILVIGIGLLFIYTPVSVPAGKAVWALSDLSRIGFAEVFSTFFSKPGVTVVIGFILTFRLGEIQLSQVKNIFLLDSTSNSGLAMSISQLAFTNTAVYLVALSIGGILGGWLVSSYGLKKVIWPMVAAVHLPNLLYYWMAVAKPDSISWINLVVGIESFGYGFGLSAFLLVMIIAAEGPYKTAHYALCTGFMSLGAMLPGMWSGYLSELVGYQTFFLLVMLFCVPGVLFIPFLPIPADFGMKAKKT